MGEQLVKNIAHPIRAFRLRIGENASSEEPANPAEIIDEPEIPAASAAISELSGDTEAALELAFWESVKDGTPAELESYLEKYPEGTSGERFRDRPIARQLRVGSWQEMRKCLLVGPAVAVGSSA